MFTQHTNIQSYQNGKSYTINSNVVQNLILKLSTIHNNSTIQSFQQQESHTYFTLWVGPSLVENFDHNRSFVLLSIPYSPSKHLFTSMRHSSSWGDFEVFGSCVCCRRSTLPCSQRLQGVRHICIGVTCISTQVYKFRCLDYCPVKDPATYCSCCISLAQWPSLWLQF